MKTGKSFQRVSMTLLSLWLGLFVVVPFILILLFSFLKRDEENFVALPINLESYRMILDPMYLKVFLNSLSISLLTTLVCLLFGYPFAFILTKLKRRWRNLALVLVIIPFWTNSLVRIYGIRVFIGSNGFLNKILLSLGLIQESLELLYTYPAVILGTVYIYFPFMVLPLYAVIEKLDPHLMEAASDLGAKRASIFLKIILPLTMPGIVAGSLLVFLPSLGCFYAADMLGGSRLLLLGNVVRGQFLEARDWPFGSSVSVGLILLMSFMMAAYFYSKKYVHAAKKELIP